MAFFSNTSQQLHQYSHFFIPLRGFSQIDLHSWYLLYISLAQPASYTLTWAIYTWGTLITKTITGVHYNENKQAEIHQSFTRQKLLMGNLPKHSSAKHSCYTIYSYIVLQDLRLSIQKFYICLLALINTIYLLLLMCVSNTSGISFINVMNTYHCYCTSVYSWMDIVRKDKYTITHLVNVRSCIVTTSYKICTKFWECRMYK